MGVSETVGACVLLSLGSDMFVGSSVVWTNDLGRDMEEVYTE